MRRSGLLLVALLFAGCGQSAVGPADVSPSTFPSSTVASPSPSQPNGLEPNDCTAAAAGNRTNPLGRDGISIQVPSGWAAVASDPQSETLLLQLKAPANYGPSNVVVQLRSLLGPRRGSSSINEANLDAARWTDPSTPNRRTAAGPAVSCSFGGEAAAFVQFTYGSMVEFRIYILHHADQQFPFLYEVVVDSNGVVDQQAMGDIKSILGSWAWQQ
jgi:hypothetical protein